MDVHTNPWTLCTLWVRHPGEQVQHTACLARHAPLCCSGPNDKRSSCDGYSHNGDEMRQVQAAPAAAPPLADSSVTHAIYWLCFSLRCSVLLCWRKVCGLRCSVRVYARSACCTGLSNQHKRSTGGLAVCACVCVCAALSGAAQGPCTLTCRCLKQWASSQAGTACGICCGMFGGKLGRGLGAVHAAHGPTSHMYNTCN